MKKRKKTKKNDSTTGIQLRPALVVLALVVLAIGAISAVSKQLVSGKQSGNNSTSKDSTTKKYTTVKIAGQDVQVDSQTGKVKPLNAQEAEQLAEGLKKMLKKSADGLTEVQNQDGSMSMDLEGRYRNVTVARANEDGTVTTSCVDNPRAAASALGIDPKLLGVEGTPGAPTKPAPATRQKN